MRGKQDDQSSSREFQYQPLSQMDSIRILELLPAPSGSPLRCKLSERPLSSYTNYEALSYVWGNSDLVKTITFGTEIIRITRNCSIALHHLRRQKESRFLWVDSICIDQNSPNERNHQVSMMGQVYSKAWRVVVWLGRSQIRTDTAILYIRHIAKQGLIPEKGLSHSCIVLIRCITSLSGLYESKTPALSELFGMSWFSRAWPVQEIAFSLECKILCGNSAMSADELMRFLTLVKDYTLVNDNLHRAHVHRQMWRYIRHVRSHVAPQLTNSTAMLLRTQPLEATDPRDKIFAFHGLLKELGAAIPDPDYSRPIQEVYRQAAATVILHDHRLHILASITGERQLQGLPSWVPDWSCSRPITEIASWDDYQVQRGVKPAYKVSLGQNRLILWGVMVDKVKKPLLAFPSRSGLPSNSASRDELKVLQEWLVTFAENPGYVNLVDFFAELTAKPWDRMKSPLNNSSQILSRYWVKACKTLIIPTSGYAHSPDGKNLQDYMVYLAKKSGIKGRHIRGDIAPFNNLIRTLLDRKRMFITENGSLGIASQALQAGDSIAFFQGVNLPMIIRRARSDKWKLVAPAYIYNAMERNEDSTPFLSDQFVII
ncbi:HET-domain-containing protein [Bimuria novae-zelandiae CBS 107.79]|uniref:HET-domain-containing protein n=1 Tax=Bimuria novae-zelandiae CBS 107.79 TaxID=1447943 RepID=A0A6A5V1X7_9PLEO|nr:HET-domain-containing protein [Bimuria novae-zelandiae CBS 107.79]